MSDTTFYLPVDEDESEVNSPMIIPTGRSSGSCVNLDYPPKSSRVKIVIADTPKTDDQYAMVAKINAELARQQKMVVTDNNPTDNSPSVTFDFTTLRYTQLINIKMFETLDSTSFKKLQTYLSTNTVYVTGSKMNVYYKASPESIDWLSIPCKDMGYVFFNTISYRNGSGKAIKIKMQDLVRSYSRKCIDADYYGILDHCPEDIFNLYDPIGYKWLTVVDGNIQFISDPERAITNLPQIIDLVNTGGYGLPVNAFNPTEFINRWKATKFGPISNHAYYMLCAGDPYFFRCFAKVLSNILFSPRHTLGVAISLNGSPGCGKSSFFLRYADHVLGTGDKYSIIKSYEHLHSGDYTSLINGKVMEVSDEVRDHHVKAIVKDMANINDEITNATIVEHNKYRDKKTVCNINHKIFLSNEAVPFPIGTGGESRRFVAQKCDHTHSIDGFISTTGEYSTKMKEVYNDDDFGYMMTLWLLDLRNLCEHWHPEGSDALPETEQLTAMKYSIGGKTKEFIYQLVNKQLKTCFTDEGFKYMNLTHRRSTPTKRGYAWPEGPLFDFYTRWADDQKSAHKLDNTSFKQYITKLTKLQCKPISCNGVTVRGWLVDEATMAAIKNSVSAGRDPDEEPVEIEPPVGGLPEVRDPNYMLVQALGY